MKKSDKLPTLHEIIKGQQDGLFLNDNSPESPITGTASESISGESVPTLNIANKASSQNVNDSSIIPLTSEVNTVLEWARRKALLDFYIKNSSK